MEDRDLLISQSLIFYLQSASHLELQKNCGLLEVYINDKRPSWMWNVKEYEKRLIEK